MTIIKTILTSLKTSLLTESFTGTHDNNTTKGWWEEKKRKRLKPYMKEGETVCQTMIRLATESPAGMAIIPLKISGVGFKARMNTPCCP